MQLQSKYVLIYQCYEYLKCSEKFSAWGDVLECNGNIVESSYECTPDDGVKCAQNGHGVYRLYIRDMNFIYVQYHFIYLSSCINFIYPEYDFQVKCCKAECYGEPLTPAKETCYWKHAQKDGEWVRICLLFVVVINLMTMFVKNRISWNSTRK